MRPPRDFDGYELLEEIGHGGMAWVFRARDKDLQNFVAVKILFPELAEDPTLVQRFLDEAVSAAALNHPNIVPAYRRGVFEGWLFIVMPLLTGKNLKEVLAEQSSLPTDIALLIIRDACLALAHAHRHEIVHRDVKPSNIILTREGEVKLTDFGLARRIKRDIDFTRTRPGMALGSIPYMPREQRAGIRLEAQGLKLVDVFAMGATAYELLVGERTFPGDSESEVVRAMDEDAPRPLVLKNPLVSEKVAVVIHEMLLGNPARRCAGIAQALAVFEKAIEAAQIQNERAKLRAFAQDPGGYYLAWRELRIDELRLEADLLDDRKTDTREEAIHVLECALYLDPGNQQLKKKKDRLEESRSGPQGEDKTKVYPVEEKRNHGPRRWLGRLGLVLGPVLVVVLGVALAWWAMHRSEERESRSPEGVPGAVVQIPAPVLARLSEDSTRAVPGPAKEPRPRWQDVQKRGQQLPTSPPKPPTVKPSATHKPPEAKPAQTPTPESTPGPATPLNMTLGDAKPPGSDSPADLALTILPAKPPPPEPELPCTLYVNLTGECQSARVIIDGKMGFRENRPIPLRPGITYQVRVSNPACGDLTFPFTLGSGKSKRIRVDLSVRH
jgi:serine/threonine protein kinase